MFIHNGENEIYIIGFIDLYCIYKQSNQYFNALSIKIFNSAHFNAMSLISYFLGFKNFGNPSDWNKPDKIEREGS